MTERKPVEIESTDDVDGDIACPYCKEEWADLWDYEWGHSECIEIDCPRCAEHVTLCANHSVDYTCYPGWKSEEKC